MSGNQERFQSIRERLDRDIEAIAPELLKDICSGCPHNKQPTQSGQAPCKRYSCSNVYYDHTRKRFWCKLRKQ